MQTCPSSLLSASQPKLAQMKLQTSLSDFLHPFFKLFLTPVFHFHARSRQFLSHIPKGGTSRLRLLSNLSKTEQPWFRQGLLFQQRSLMNKTVKTGISLYAEMEEKRRSSTPACPQHTLGIQYKE